MARVNVYDMNGEVVGKITLKNEIFGIEVNEAVMHQAVLNQLANRRQGTQSTKTISEISGGGRKPWRQKGTGRARQGSTRSAQWRTGGVALGPKPRSYNYSIPKKVKRLALKSALSSKVQGKDIIVVDKIELDQIKTKSFIEMLTKLKVEGTSLVVFAESNKNLILSARNVPKVKTALPNTINTFDILKYNKLIIAKDAVKKIEEVYA